MTALPKKHAFCSAEHALLESAGEGLYGPFWLTPVATQLGMAPPSLHLMRTGKSPISPRVWAGVAGLVAERVTLLESMLSAWGEAVTTEKHAFLGRVGELLYGTRWAHPMAADLEALDPALFTYTSTNNAQLQGVGKAAPNRKLARMGEGYQPIPQPLWDAARKLVRNRRAQLVAMTPKITRMQQAKPEKHAS